MLFRSTKPFLNIGCGTTHLPSAVPPGHELVNPAIYQYDKWVNVDKVEGVGADKTFDLFRYPWPLEDDSYDGALLGHIAEHIPHQISGYAPHDIYSREKAEQQVSRMHELSKLQDGWYAFFAELYRVLTPGAIVHILSPFGRSDSGINDPTHTRYLTPASFTHAMSASENGRGTFKYETGCNFEMIFAQYRPTPHFQTLREVMPAKISDQMIIDCFSNAIYDFYVQLRCVKDNAPG